MKDTTIAKDDARQTSQHTAVKAQVESQVNAEIADEAATASPEGQAKVVDVAAELRDKAVDETVAGERAVSRGRTAARGSQFVDYGFYVVYSLLGIRLVLALIAANSSNGFVKFIRAVTDPFYAPFKGIVSSPSAGGYTLLVPIMIALVIYLLLHLAINGVLRMVAQRKTTI
jgi:uncharacterized protein YggT (Ycf19 family)